MSDFKQFTFNQDNTVVTGMFELKKSKLKAEKLTGKTFEITLNDDSSDVLAVTVSKETRSKVETDVYTDSNLDNIFVGSFELDVSKTISIKDFEKYKFTGTGGLLTGESQAGESVIAVQELSKKRWKSDYISSNETIETIILDGQLFVLKTEISGNGDIEFDLFKDNNDNGIGNGIWTKVAEGEATAEYLVETGGLDALLIGISEVDGLLDPAASIIG